MASAIEGVYGAMAYTALLKPGQTKQSDMVVLDNGEWRTLSTEEKMARNQQHLPKSSDVKTIPMHPDVWYYFAIVETINGGTTMAIYDNKKWREITESEMRNLAEQVGGL